MSSAPPNQRGIMYFDKRIDINKPGPSPGYSGGKIYESDSILAIYVTSGGASSSLYNGINACTLSVRFGQDFKESRIYITIYDHYNHDDYHKIIRLAKEKNDEALIEYAISKLSVNDIVALTFVSQHNKGSFSPLPLNIAAK